jgi:ribosomal protein S18 acetylase RimI-like enzyme
MDTKQIARYIDDGANYYLRLFGDAEHMELIDNGYFSYVMPKAGERGITFVFDIRLDNLSLEAKKDKITEIKALNMPIWLNILASDDLHNMMFGNEKEHGKTVLANHDEAYMALLPHEKTTHITDNKDITIIKVETKEQYRLWTDIANGILSGGSPDMHPEYHYPLIQKGLMQCYIGYKNNIPSAVAAYMDNKGIDSLEFVATVPMMRRQGLANAVCRRAINDAFENGAKIITLRAFDIEARTLYESLGFRIYNYVL